MYIVSYRNPYSLRKTVIKFKDKDRAQAALERAVKRGCYDYRMIKEITIYKKDDIVETGE